MGKREQLALAIFESIEGWYNPRRRHSYCKMLSPVDYEAVRAAERAENAIFPRKRFTRSPQRPAEPAGGINTPGDPNLCGLSITITIDVSVQPGEAQPRVCPAP